MKAKKIFIGHRVLLRNVAKGLVINADKYPNGMDRLCIRWDSKKDSMLAMGMPFKECWTDADNPELKILRK